MRKINDKHHRDSDRKKEKDKDKKKERERDLRKLHKTTKTNQDCLRTVVGSNDNDTIMLGSNPHNTHVLKIS